MTRPYLARTSTLTALLTLVLACGIQADLHGNDIVQVEEDWELAVSSPDPNVTAPQAMCTFSPLGDVGSLYAVLNVNYLNAGDFVPGGLELQAWNGDALLGHTHYKAGVELRSEEELVRWTNRLSVSNGKVYFAVTGGQSFTWGTFGNGSELQLSVSSSLANLNGYDPQISADNSGVVFAGNRVEGMVLRRVRLTTSDGVVVSIDVNLNVD